MARKSPRVSFILESILGCKWSLHILGVIRKGMARPGVIQRSAEGLTTKVMNERLRKMLRFGILEKKSYPVIPLKVEYRLTAFGRRFIQLLNHIERLERKIKRSKGHTRL